MYELLSSIDGYVWGPPLLILLVGTGIYLSGRLGFIQMLKLPTAIRLIFTDNADEDGDISSFAALATALAATIGTGNIVGVATAIKLGGPGALFWMWVAAFFGMATKYAEGLLAIKYRVTDENGEKAGGPMYYITNGLEKKWKWLAILFSIFGTMTALFGSGTFTQVNSITESLRNTTGLSSQLVSPILAILVGIIIFGGIQSISKVSEKVVPFMAGIYVLAALTVIIFNAHNLIPSLLLVFKSAFTGQAAMGGFAGAGFMLAIQSGVARGVFSNESGLGSAPIAAAAARTNEPVEQGLISMTGTFIDTIIICTLTGLSIIITDAWSTDLNGAVLTQYAFSTIFGDIGQIALAVSLVLFAFTTILGWSYYGERCFEFLFGSKAILLYRIIYVLMIAIGGYISLETIWVLADIVNGLMAFPNLVALLGLSPVIISETQKYFAKKK
ncbi:alanine/glycine:cation symporter family protein [Streptococcus hyovaginalis]|uniref:alanine/glycine:cation symporter family protein n=1 Tax=Streptococcus hyovaginalis TaxID=149015 RepID=UPI0004A497AD|nr:sodium:alanine symporter family protein [Streptococcus hyovaginalis]